MVNYTRSCRSRSGYYRVLNIKDSCFVIPSCPAQNARHNVAGKLGISKIRIFLIVAAIVCRKVGQDSDPVSPYPVVAGKGGSCHQWTGMACPSELEERRRKPVLLKIKYYLQKRFTRTVTRAVCDLSVAFLFFTE